MPVQRAKIECPFRYDGRHPGAAFGPRNRDSVNAGMQDPLECADLLRYLGGRYVFAFPAKGLADAIDEVEEALLILAHQVAGPHPGVACREDIAQNSLLGLSRIGIALEPAASALRIDLYLADRLARLVDPAANAETVLVADRFPSIVVEGDQRGREAVRQIGRDVADGSRLALHVKERETSLRGRVKLENLRDAKTLLELLPHAGREAVATS